MIKKIFFLIALLLALLSQAQVTVNVQLPPAGMIQKDQFWNLVVANNNGEISETFISLDIKDAYTGQTVLSAGSRSFVLGKGIKIISIRDVQPVQYNYIAAELSGAYIPLGNYIACYRIVGNTVKGPEPLGDECVRVNINPLSPPMLTTPFDRVILQNTYPQFSWMPPTPTDMFSNLNYDIVVAEVLSGQSAAEAILYNTPVYTNHNLRIAYENYPSTFSKLKEGQQYAWQVTARNELNYAAKTEVWSFVIKMTDTVAQSSSDAGYMLLKNNNDPAGISYISNNLLRVKYYSFDKTHDTKVRIVSSDKKLLLEIKQKIVYGDNFLEFKLSNKFSGGTIYTVEITDGQNNIYSSRFGIK